jgi:PAS domain S-box-containing protein
LAYWYQYAEVALSSYWAVQEKFLTEKKDAGMVNKTDDRMLIRRLKGVHMRLAQHAAAHPETELLPHSLDEICALLESPLGFLYDFSAEQESAQTAQMVANRVVDPGDANLHAAGVWARGQVTDAPVIDNAYAARAGREQLQTGVALQRLVVAPIVRHGRPVALLGVANKTAPYTAEDMELVDYLADVLWLLVQEKRADARLQESEERLRLAGEVAYDLNYEWHVADDRLIWFGDIDGVLGYEPGTITNNIESWMGLIHPDERPDLEAAVELHRKATTPIGYQYWILGGDGRYRCWYDKAHPVLDEDGRPLRWVGVCRDITAEMQASKVIDNFFEQSMNLHLIAGLDSEIKRVNNGWERYLGYAAGELVGRSFLELVHPDDQEGTLAEMARLGAGETTFHFENRYRHKSGAYRLLAWSATADVDEHIIYAIASDITEQRAVEKALQESEARYRTFFELIPDIVYVLNTNGELLDWNLTLEKYVDLPREELPNQQTLNYFAGQDPQKVLDAFSRLAAGERISGLEVIVDLPGTGLVDMEVNAAPIFEDGEVRQFISLARDITERKRTEQRLRENEANLSALIENTEGEIWSLDREYRLIVANSSYQRVVKALTGRTFSRGDSVLDPFPEEVRTFWRSIYDRALAGESFSLVLDQVIGGEQLSIEFHFSPIRNTEGEITGLTGYGRDITAQREVETLMRIKDSAIATSLNAIALADPAGNLSYVNQSFLEMWGYADAAEVLGKPAVSFWAQPEMAGAVVEALFTSGKWFGELTGVKKDGAFFSAQLSANLIIDEAGRPLALMSSFIDITEQKERNDALRLSEERYRLLFESANDFVFLHGFDTLEAPGYFIEVNQHTCDRLGYTLEEMRGLRPTDIVTEADLATVPQEAQTLSSGAELVFEKNLKSRSGELIPVELHATTFHYQGQLLVLSIGRDLTERKRAEEGLRWRNQALESSPVSVVITDTAGEIQYVNRFFTAVTGYTAAEAAWPKSAHPQIRHARSRNFTPICGKRSPAARSGAVKSKIGRRTASCSGNWRRSPR